MKSIQIYGKLEELLSKSEPERRDMLFAIGTLRNKMKLSAGEVYDVLTAKSCWNDYTLQKSSEVLKVESPTKIFFSPLKEEVKTWHYNKGKVRSVANNEIALDIDSKELFERGVKYFEAWDLKGNCRTWQGAKGGHISLFFDSSVSDDIKKKLRDFFGGDIGQINISVEGQKHQKTGNVVKVIRERIGTNKVSEIESLLEEFIE